MYCGYCGKEVENDAKYCSHCGKPIKKDRGNNGCFREKESPQEEKIDITSSSPNPNNNGISKYIAIAIFFLYIGYKYYDAYFISDEDNTSISNGSQIPFGSAQDHNGKPCHDVQDNGRTCDCSGFKGGNWDAYTCVKCSHHYNKHY